MGSPVDVLADDCTRELEGARRPLGLFASATVETTVARCNADALARPSEAVAAVGRCTDREGGRAVKGAEMEVAR